MSQRDGFAGGFLAGAIFGSVVGGILGATIASRRDNELIMEEGEEVVNGSLEGKKPSFKRRQMRARENEGMEIARRSLEDKIAQLNATIDDVQNQLGKVNGDSTQANERSLS
jgi:outer membrane lipoprotein SlyB